MTVELPTFRLLYIDEDEAWATNLAHDLGALGVDVTQLLSGKGASAFLAEQGFDVILLGEGALLRDFALVADAPPVVCLIGEESAFALDALQSGAFDYVTKRMDKDFARLLAAVLARAVGNARLLVESRILRKQAQEARAKADMLLNEMKHRIANSLALAVSMAHLQAGAMPQGDARRAVTNLAERISAVAQVHKGLYSALSVGSVALDTYLGALVRELERGYRDRKALTAISFESAPLSVTVDQAISLGVIVSELIGNAARFAYPGRAKGVVRVMVKPIADDDNDNDNDNGDRDGADMLLLVEDDGVGLTTALDPYPGAGLGSQLINVLAHGLSGKFEINTIADAGNVTGARAMLRFASATGKPANVKAI